MAFRLECPHCGRRLEADDENIGAITGCPTCQKDFVIERPRVQLAAETTSDFVTLACPSCGGQLGITGDIRRFSCVHCGREHLVRRNEGSISLLPVVEGIKKVQSAVDKTASELAIVRIKGETSALELERKRVQGLRVLIWCMSLLLLVIIISCIVPDPREASPKMQLLMAAITLVMMLGVSTGDWACFGRATIAKIDERVARKTDELQKHERQVSL